VAGYVRNDFNKVSTQGEEERGIIYAQKRTPDNSLRGASLRQQSKYVWAIIGYL
jgi:hypothetical protein